MYEQSPILEVKGLQKTFSQGKQSHVALHKINFSLFPGETLGLVGNSGSGKSTLGSCLLKLTQPDEGEILYLGTRIDNLKGTLLQQYRKDIQLIFQDPFSSLNPKMTIKNILGDVYSIHKGANNLKIDCIFISDGVHRKEFNNFSELNKLLEKYNVNANFFQRELKW